MFILLKFYDYSKCKYSKECLWQKPHFETPKNDLNSIATKLTTTPSLFVIKIKQSIMKIKHPDFLRGFKILFVP